MTVLFCQDVRALQMLLSSFRDLLTAPFALLGSHTDFLDLT